VYRLADLRIVKAEVLLRWTHPTLGRVSPAEFSPVAERSGLITPIGTWVLNEACRAALAWPDLFQGRRCPVAIECAGTLTTGMTVVDWWRQTGKPDNCLWLNRCDGPAFYARMADALARL
jgi:EAL domain-containing protein (putative c-di-GMP-specific phosphodiesterase class I)